MRTKPTGQVENEETRQQIDFIQEEALGNPIKLDSTPTTDGGELKANEIGYTDDNIFINIEGEVRNIITTKTDDSRLVPSGSLMIWATDTAPTGYLLCSGQSVSRTTYSALFTVIGTTYGVGDGSTTFDLPDLRGRVPLGKDNMGGTSADRVTNAQADSLAGSEGAEDHVLTEAELANHRHSLTSTSGASGAVFGYEGLQTPGSVLATGFTGDDDAHNNMQPYITLNYIIKT